MRAFFAVVAVVVALFLGIIAAELYPIARVASALVGPASATVETAAARRVRRQATYELMDEALRDSSKQKP